MTNTTIGRRPEVTDDSIVRAGQKLIDEGRRVTGFALRKEVGNTGDPKRLLKVWLAHLSSQSVTPDDALLDIPVELEKALHSVVDETTEKLKSLALELNSAAVNTAEQRVRAAIELANKREQEAEAEVHDAALTIDDLEKQLTTLSLEYAQCQQALQLSKEETKAQTKLAGEFNLEISTLAVQLSCQQKENEKLALSADSAQQKIDNLVAVVSELKEEKSELRSENKRLAIELSKLSNERDKQLGELIAKLDTTTNDAA